MVWAPGPNAEAPGATAETFIVQGTNLDATRAAVEGVGATITHEFGIIDGVAAALTPDQLDRLRRDQRITSTFDNGAVATAGGVAGGSPAAYVHYPELVGAEQLHTMGYTGQRDITVAFVDSGMAAIAELQKDTSGVGRMAGRYNAMKDQEGPHNDNYGHGTHVASIIFNTDYADDGSGRRNSIAPNAGALSVKAFNGQGQGTYADVLRGLDWLLAHKDERNIRVVNLSFSAEPQSHYWDDPINQAVMRLWEAGVVVVTSAGNTGPDAMSIGVPGNNPYVITVGAMSDNYTPGDASDDVLASFSSAGPTVEGFVKPDIVAPGGHMVARGRVKSNLAKQHPEFHDQGSYFMMSGTSQATAVVTGIVALMLEQDPYLTPDEVKYRLMASARPAVNPDGTLAYSVFQQGAGMVHAFDAVFGGVSGFANRGLDVAADL